MPVVFSLKAGEGGSQPAKLARVLSAPKVLPGYICGSARRGLYGIRLRTKWSMLLTSFRRSALCQLLTGGPERRRRTLFTRPVGQMLLDGSHRLQELGVGGRRQPWQATLFLPSACPGEANIMLEANFPYGECCRRSLGERGPSTRRLCVVARLRGRFDLDLVGRNDFRNHYLWVACSLT